ncbi:MAG TPA: pitrilysin family protein [Blastocatellia bacterium]|nr:pitrilysin family protein [Blastocatellia bacterium]
MKRLLILLFIIAIAAPARAADGALKLPPFKKVKLANGLTVMLMEQHEVPIISFNFVIRAGAVADPAGKAGVAALTAGLLRKGTRTRSADQIASELDFIGGTLNATASYDYSNGAAEFVKKDIGKGLDLLSDVLTNATFPQDEVVKMLKQRTDAVKAAKDQPEAVIGNYFSAYLYGNHPYARPVGGDEPSLAAITRDDVVRFYQTYYTPANAILAVVGDFNTAEMQQALTDKFGAWSGKATAPASAPEARAFTGKKLLLIDKPDATQTFYQIGNVGISRTNPDRVYIQVINTLFGGRFTSMLNSALRIQSGLTYGARSTFNQLRSPGPFAISTFTPNATTEKAIDMTLDVLRRLHDKGITEEELKSAKSYLKGQFPPTIETSDQLAGLLAQLEFYGLDESDVNNYYAKVDSMTIEDAQRVIKQYFPADNLVFVLIGKASEIQGAAKKYATQFDTRAISQPGF